MGEIAYQQQEFARAADLTPQENLGFVGLGVSYMETGHDAQAIQVLRRQLQEKPNDASLLYLLGEASSGRTPHLRPQSTERLRFPLNSRYDSTQTSACGMSLPAPSASMRTAPPLPSLSLSKPAPSTPKSALADCRSEFSACSQLDLSPHFRPPRCLYLG